MVKNVAALSALPAVATDISLESRTYVPVRGTDGGNTHALLLGSDLPAGFDVTVFGGIPVETDTGGRSKDTLHGARISQGRAGLYRIGASYLND